MKYFHYLLFVLLLVACDSGEEAPNCENKEYDQEFTTQLGESICFPDGNSFEVKTITDQFCCCLCYCKWEGELQVIVETTDPSGKKDLFTFGTTTYKSNNEIFKGFTITAFDYRYDGEPDSLPLCEGEFDKEKVDLLLKITSQ